MTLIPNVLAERYASEAMRRIWSPEGKIVLEREFWIAVMKAQRDLGLNIPDGVIEAYEAVRDQVDVAAIERRERVTRHDVKARIEAFCEAAGHEHIHKGMTSRDLTENVEQLQVYRSLMLVRDRAAAALVAFAKRARQWQDLVITGRTHNVAAQPTTFGKRLAMFAEETLIAFNAIESVLAHYPARGLKGAVGTQLDLLTLFGGDAARVASAEQRILAHLGLPAVFDAVGQVYPRSLDFQVVAALVQLSSGPCNFARTLRLMAGHETASEGFAEGQVGSSAMPHKMNARSCERINGFGNILKGHLNMVAGLVGDQWNEGDVSCSVVRRAVLADAFFAIDGLLETLLTVLRQMDAFPAVIDRENRRYLPFLITTTILMEAVKAGAGRESAHEAIKQHAVATVGELRSGAIETNNLLERLAGDARLGLSRARLEQILGEAAALTGAAVQQVGAVCARIDAVAARLPEAAAYQPGDIL